MRVALKSVWLYPSRPDWRATLRTEPQQPLGACPALDLPPDAPAAAREFGRSDLPEGRRQERTVPPVQDTTALNFTLHATVMSGLGP